MTKIIYTLLFIFFLISPSQAQNCLVKEMTQERINDKGEAKELLQYNFSYTADGKLEKINILDNSSSGGNTEHIVKYEQTELGRKITWFWDGEYNSHFFITKNSLLEFSSSDDENDTDLENADQYPLTFKEDKLILDEDGNTTFKWEDNLATESVRQGRKYKDTTVFTYADDHNPFYGLFELGIIQISADNFIPLLYTLSDKVLASEDTKQTKDGIEQVYNKDHKYSHTSNENKCVEQFVVNEKYDKVLFTFKY